MTGLFGEVNSIVWFVQNVHLLKKKSKKIVMKLKDGSLKTVYNGRGNLLNTRAHSKGGGAVGL